MSDSLKRLSSEHGQSPWLDNLQRGYLTTGTLAALIERGVRGLTSNPTIFQKAIQGSADYDEQFRSEIQKGSTARDAYWELVLQDIHGALDAFANLYSQSGGADGFVSVEVDPSLAHDTAGTLSAARLLHERIARPNVMIKIPATQQGLSAIREMIAEGRNVNVTLIFSLSRYQEVMDAYIEGLEQRMASGAPVSGIASVASFFISRVDNEIDKRLDQLGTAAALALRGTAAINQARLAYAAFQKTFSGPRWDALAKAGAALGLPADQAARLAIATLEGSAIMAADADVSPAILADRVASPGGSTREGMNVLDRDDALVALLTETLAASERRNAEMAAAAR